MPNFYIKLVMGALYDFRDFQEGTFWRPFSATKASKMDYSQFPMPSQDGPSFSRNHGNCCAVGTYWSLKGRLLAQVWPHFLFVLLFLWYVLYNILITSVHKSSVNAKPLSPPFFEKIAPHFKKLCLEHLIICVDAF